MLAIIDIIFCGFHVKVSFSLEWKHAAIDGENNAQWSSDEMANRYNTTEGESEIVRNRDREKMNDRERHKVAILCTLQSSRVDVTYLSGFYYRKQLSKNETKQKALINYCCWVAVLSIVLIVWNAVRWVCAWCVCRVVSSFYIVCHFISSLYIQAFRELAMIFMH